MSAIIKSRRCTTHTITHTDYSNVEFEVSFEPYDNNYVDSIHLKKVSDSVVLVGYLSHDDDARDPLEHQEGMGKIYSAHKWSTTKDDMQNALGLDSYWEPDLDRIDDDAVRSKYAEYYAANMTVAECIQQGRDNNGESNEDFLIRCANEDFDDWRGRTYSDAFDEFRTDLWHEGRKNGTIGTQYAISLDVYDHSGQSFSISGEGMQCRWDTSSGGALWVPDPCCLEHIMSKPEAERKACAYECCKVALEEYNAWLCGDTYGVCIATCDLNTGEELESDECWGYYTDTYAVQALKESLGHHVERFTGGEIQ